MQFILRTDVIFQGILNCDKHGITLSKTLAPRIFINCVTVSDDVLAVKNTPKDDLSSYPEARFTKETFLLTYSHQELKSTSMIQGLSDKNIPSGLKTNNGNEPTYVKQFATFWPDYFFCSSNLLTYKLLIIVFPLLYICSST